MHMVWHDFHLNDFKATFGVNFLYQCFQPNIYAIVQDLAAVFWAPDHMIFAEVTTL